MGRYNPLAASWLAARVIFPLLFPLRSEWATHSCVAHGGRRTYLSLNLNIVPLGSVKGILTGISDSEAD
jgi:hypothetical protein